MKEIIINQGDVYWWLTVVKETSKNKYLCRCVCGATKTVDKYILRRGQVKSCGCQRVQPDVWVPFISVKNVHANNCGTCVNYSPKVNEQKICADCSREKHNTVRPNYERRA